MIFKKEISISSKVTQDRCLGYEYDDTTRTVLLEDGYNYSIIFDPKITQEGVQVSLIETS